MNCNKCGKDNPPDNRFCDNCGNELQQAAPAPASPMVAGSGGNECPACKHPNPAGSAFCESCGASMQNVVQNAVPAPAPIPAPIAPPPQQFPQIDKALVLPDGSEIAIQSRKSIGRLDLAKYAAPTETMWISRQHIEIFEENGATFILDDKSSNGTKLNGKEIKQQGKQQLKNGDEIIVGDAVKLVFKIKSP
jgi:hypothetical protein